MLGSEPLCLVQASPAIPAPSPADPRVLLKSCHNLLHFLLSRWIPDVLRLPRGNQWHFRSLTVKKETSASHWQLLDRPEAFHSLLQRLRRGEAGGSSLPLSNPSSPSMPHSMQQKHGENFLFYYLVLRTLLHDLTLTAALCFLFFFCWGCSKVIQRKLIKSKHINREEKRKRCQQSNFLIWHAQWTNTETLGEVRVQNDWSFNLFHNSFCRVSSNALVLINQ